MKRHLDKFQGDPFHPFPLFRNRGIHDKRSVKVPVANVTERSNREAMFQADPLNFRDCFRDSAYGHPEIFHKGDEAVTRLKSAHRWDQPSPCSKELRFLNRIIGPDIFQAAYGFAYVIDLLDLIHHSALGTVDPYEQLAVHLFGYSHFQSIASHIETDIVKDLAGSQLQPRCKDYFHSFAGCIHVREGSFSEGLVLRHGKNLQYSFGDNPEGPLRTGKEVSKVVTRGTFRSYVPSLYHFPVSQNDSKTFHIVLGSTILGRANSASIGSDHSTDSSDGRAAGVRGEEMGGG